MYTDETERQIEREKDEKKERKNKNLGKIIAIVFFGIILLGLLYYALFMLEPAVKWEISNKNLTVEEGQEVQIVYTLNKEKVVMNYTSQDEKIATVDEKGLVKGVSKGNTTINLSFTYKEKSYADSVTITVNEAPKPVTPVNPTPNNNSSSNNGNSGNNSGKSTTTPLSLTYSVEGNKNLDTWQSSDIVLNVTAKGQNKLEYAVDCGTTCVYNQVTDNKVIVSTAGQHTITIRATSSSGQTKEEKVVTKIDKTPPTCSLNLKDNLIVLTKDDDYSGMAYYGENSSYSGDTNSNSKTAVEGTHTFYVKDKAGNTNKCSIQLANKTQYRSQKCTACKTCQQAGCAEVWSCGAKSQSACTSQAGCKWENNQCKQKAYCKTYNANCGTCGGCNTWGSWSNWQDAAITSSSTVKVETRKILVKVS